MKKHKYIKIVHLWLNIGLIMLIGQVVLGGITRLTGSGLSITRWDIITGVVPPLNRQQWMDAFDLYKETPQFHKINSSFSLQNFKFIYFWEYFHRFWVRLLGLIFIVPFIIFSLKKKIDFYLIKRLTLVVFLTALTASAGWIMVQSGLINRPWVNAYKLTLHFILAVLSITAMVKTIADVNNFENKYKKSQTGFVTLLLSVTFIQLILAGLMSGMKAGLYFPTWPSMNGKFIPEVLLNPTNWNFHNLTNYDNYAFAPALVQFFHRLFAYIILGLTLYLYYSKRNHLYTRAIKWITISYVLIIIQVILGIFTLLKIKSGIPIFFGVSHQLTGLLFLISLLFLYYSLRKKT